MYTAVVAAQKGSMNHVTQPLPFPNFPNGFTSAGCHVVERRHCSTAEARYKLPLWGSNLYLSEPLAMDIHPVITHLPEEVMVAWVMSKPISWRSHGSEAKN
jgi:hypothetical protein